METSKFFESVDEAELQTEIIAFFHAKHKQKDANDLKSKYPNIYLFATNSFDQNIPEFIVDGSRYTINQRLLADHNHGKVADSISKYNEINPLNEIHAFEEQMTIIERHNTGDKVIIRNTGEVICYVDGDSKD